MLAVSGSSEKAKEMMTMALIQKKYMENEEKNLAFLIILQK